MNFFCILLLNGFVNRDAWEVYEYMMEMTDGETAQITDPKKSTLTVVFNDATLTINKWHSNAPVLEAESNSPSSEKEMAGANQQLGGTRP